MKILEVIRSLNVGGSQKLLLNRLSTRAAKSHQTVVFNTLPSESGLQESFNAEGIHVESSHSDSVLISSFELVRLIRNQNFDLVISHSVLTTIVLVIGKMTRLIYIPVIEVAHQTRHSIKILEWLKELINKKTDLILPVSEAVSESPIARGARRVKVIHHGIPLQFMNDWVAGNQGLLDAFRNEMSMGFEQPLRVIYCARLVAFKRIDLLIRAVAKATIEKVTLTVVGSGPMKDMAVQLVDELRISDRVRFLGEISDGWKMVAAADILALPSDSEGLSVSLMEALAVGTPCLVTDIPGMREILNEDFDSLFASPGSYVGLAEKLELVASNRTLLRDLRLGAKKQGLLWDQEVSAKTLYVEISALPLSARQGTTNGETRP